MIEKLSFKTTKKQELVDITNIVQDKITKIKDGYCIVYVPHATAAITINEGADPNLADDILKALDQMVPESNNWKHDKIDNNAASHIKSAIIGPSETIPIKNGKLLLGTWQNIFLCDFDGPRNRNIMIQVIGE